MKKLLIIFMCLCFFVCGCTEKKQNSDALASAFMGLNAELEEMRLVAWKLCTREFLSMEQLKLLVLEAATAMKLEILGEEAADNENYRSYTILAQRELTQYTLVAQGVPNESYLLISAKSKEKIEEFNILRDELMQAAGRDASIHALLIGSREGVRTQEVLEQELLAAMKACKAELVEQAAENGFVSCTGYLQEFGNTVLSGVNSVNIQLGASNNEQKGRTYYYLGYPLIFNDY